IVNVAFPALERSFPHDAQASLAWVITGYSIVFGALLVVAGRTADRIGSRRVFFAGLAIFCLGSALAGLAPSVPLLVAGRLVQGVGAAALLPSSLGLLLAAVPSAGFGWRAAFYVNLPIGLVAWLVGRNVLPTLRGDTTRSSPDYPGVVLLSGALAALVLAISEGPGWGWSSGWIIASFATALGLGAGFLRRSARHAEPV